MHGAIPQSTSADRLRKIVADLSRVRSIIVDTIATSEICLGQTRSNILSEAALSLAESGRGLTRLAGEQEERPPTDYYLFHDGTGQKGHFAVIPEEGPDGIFLLEDIADGLNGQPFAKLTRPSAPYPRMVMLSKTRQIADQCLRILVTVTALNDNLEGDDADVPGRYIIYVDLVADDDGTDAYVLEQALDYFHDRVEIANREDFDILAEVTTLQPHDDIRTL